MTERTLPTFAREGSGRRGGVHTERAVVASGTVIRDSTQSWREAVFTAVTLRTLRDVVQAFDRVVSADGARL